MGDEWVKGNDEQGPANRLIAHPPRLAARRRRRAVGLAATLVVALITLIFVSCEREKRQFSEPQSNAPGSSVRQSELQPGPPVPQTPFKNEYEDNAYAVSEGKRFFEQYNCVGCHAHGGGAIGPPLMDDRWIYGASPQNIFATIVEGRPNGMPSFGDKIPESQIWQIVAYVRSMSGQLPKDISPSRSDHMQGKPAEQSSPALKPKTQGAEHRQ